MLAARLLCALLLALVLASPAQAAAPVSRAAPTGLRAFLFRADEPLRHEFARTPSFAWRPVSGAARYEFELSMSNTFRENGIIFARRDLRTPVASIALTLPWITGEPYSLYARVRAVLPNGGATRWSQPFGFNMRQTEVPRPLPSYPGLLRWTPIEGASAYEVRFIDIPKSVVTYSNVVDEREFYTFHQGPLWISNVRWRIRTLRADIGDSGVFRANGVPVVQYGPWSPVYENVNPPFAVTTMNGTATVSDVVSTGQGEDPAHRLMPAFVFTGNQTWAGTSAELYRVYVFTDEDCINRVYSGAIVGSPAYAPRPFGPLALPKDTAALAAMRSSYPGDGDQGTTYTEDGEPIAPNESVPAAKPTASLPGVGSSPSAPTAPASDSSSAQPATSAPSSGGVTFYTVGGQIGAPVDLWDTSWPEGGYYWTVVPVEAASPPSLTTTVGEPGADIGSTTLPVANAQGFATGDVLEVGNASNQESVTVRGVNGNALTLATALKIAHGIGEPIVRLSGNLVYRDLELAQDVCRQGRWLRFGKSSEPTLVTAGAPFASGLSPKGRLTAASAGSPLFYGAPLVAWTPALGADSYHVQWSKTRYPFKPQVVTTQNGSTEGVLTLATSAVLPLAPGTWWYRVRGVSWNLPSNAQFMGWSEPARIVVTRPKFRVSGGR
jgi:hypothetical protein